MPGRSFVAKTKKQKMFLRVLFFVVGAFFLYGATLDVRDGRITSPRTSHVIDATNDPVRFWLVCGSLVAFGCLGLVEAIRGRKDT